MDAANKGSSVPANDAVLNRQFLSVVDAAAATGRIGVSIADDQAVDRDRSLARQAVIDIQYAHVIAANGQHAGTWAGDGQIAPNLQLPLVLVERDRTGQASLKPDFIRPAAAESARRDRHVVVSCLNRVTQRHRGIS